MFMRLFELPELPGTPHVPNEGNNTPNKKHVLLPSFGSNT